VIKTMSTDGHRSTKFCMGTKMKDVTISAKTGGKDAAPHSIQYNQPETLEELVDTYGESVVYKQAITAIVISLQGFMRSKINAEDPVTGRALQDAVNEWKPGARERAGSPARLERIKGSISKMSAEEKAELLAAINAQTTAVQQRAAAPATAAAARPTAGKPRTIQGGRR
jgi:hypothetical protein